MKLTVEANDFCLDDCPQCELGCEERYADDKLITKIYFCKHKEFCKSAIERFAKPYLDAFKEDDGKGQQ